MTTAEKDATVSVPTCLPEVDTQSATAAPAAAPSDRSISVLRAVFAVSGMVFLCMVPVTMLVAPLKELVGLRYQAGPFWTHSFMSVNMVGAILAAPLIGLLSDAGGARRRVAAMALFTDAALLTAMGWAPNLTTLLILRFFEGAAHILALSTLMAVAAGWAAEKSRGRAMGIVGSAMMFGTACGTRTGGEVWRLLPDWTFLVAGCISAVAAVGVLALVREPHAPRTDRGGMKAALAILAQRRELAVPYAYALIDRFCVGVVVSTLVLYFADIHELEPRDRSRLLVFFLVPFAVLIYPAGRLVDRIGRVWPIALASATFGVVFASYGVASAESLRALMIISGIVSAIMFAPNLALCADLAPSSHRGAVFTGFNAAGSFGFLLGPLAAGAFFSAMTRHGNTLEAYQATFLATGCTQVLCAAITLPLLLRLRRLGLTR